MIIRLAILLALLGAGGGAVYVGSTYLSDDADEVILSTPGTTVDEVTELTAEETAEAVEDVAEETAAVEEAAEEVLAEVAPAAVPEEPVEAPVLDVVRVEPSGEVLIAGNAAEGDRVGLLYNDQVVAEADVTAGGDFVLMPEDALPTGEGTLEVVVIDNEGNRAALSEGDQVAVVLPEDGSDDGFLVSVLRPGEPVEIIERQAPVEEVAAEAEVPEVEVAARAEPATQEPVEQPAAEPEAPELPEVEVASPAEPAASVEVEEANVPESFVSLDAIELEGQSVWIAGAALPDTIIRLYQDNALLGEVAASEQGRYLFEGALFDATGTVTVRADALAPGTSEVVARAEVPFEMPAVEAPEVAQVAETPAADTIEAADTPAAETADTGAPSAESEAVETSEAVIQPESSTEEVAAETASAASAETSERVSVLDTGRVIIRRGDNLWVLSRRVYGLGIRYTSIYDANIDQIRDPDLIFPGQVFDLPTPREEWGEVPGLDALEPDQVPGPEVLQN